MPFLKVISIVFITPLVSCLTTTFTKPNGDLDVTALTNHILHLEQTLADIQSQSKVKEQKQIAILSSVLSKLTSTTEELSRVQTDLHDLQKEHNTTLLTLADLERKYVKMETRLENLEQVCNLTSEMLEAVKNQNSSQTAMGKKLTSEMLYLKHQNETLAELNEMQNQVKTDMNNLKSEHKSTLKELSNVKQEMQTINARINGTVQLEREGDATFTRWGRTSCPASSKIIYKGYVGGTNYTLKGSSASILCLPEHPIYAAHTTDRHYAFIYGTEYEIRYAGAPLKNLQNEDMPCVVCESETRRSAIMVPARNQCYPGWNLEYWGYMMGAGYNHASAEFICVDKDAETVPGGHEDKNGQVLYIVESRCGSLPCPPYKENWEITCVVCSK